MVSYSLGLGIIKCLELSLLSLVTRGGLSLSNLFLHFLIHAESGRWQIHDSSSGWRTPGFSDWYSHRPTGRERGFVKGRHISPASQRFQKHHSWCRTSLGLQHVSCT